MNADDIVRDRDTHAWRYSCDCGYLTIALPFARAQFAQRIHRHRHLMGLAGIYHHEGHDT